MILNALWLRRMRLDRVLRTIATRGARFETRPLGDRLCSMAAQHRVRDGWRLFWDVGYWLDYEDADEALDAYCALASLPAFQEDVRRPRIFRRRDGKTIFGDSEAPPAEGGVRLLGR